MKKVLFSSRVQALERKRVLVEQLKDIVTEMRRINKGSNHYAALLERKIATENELGVIKGWMHANHDEAATETPQAILCKSWRSVSKYIDSLQKYAEYLRQRLAVYEKELPTAPGFESDWWREQE